MNGTAGTVRELIERQAALRPRAVYAVAVDAEPRAQRTAGLTAHADAHRLASADTEPSLSFAQLAQACRAVGALLRAQGSRPGDTVSLIMPNGLITLQLLLGAMHGGWVVNPVNLLSQPDQMRYVLMHSDCNVVIVAPDWDARVRALLIGLERQVILLVIALDADHLPAMAADARTDAGPEAFRDATHEAAPRPDALALLMYTSGTTGVPKGVMLTQANLAANAQTISIEHALAPSDRVLAVLPLYHINAFAVTMLAPLVQGGSLAMPPKFSAARFWAQAAASRCTWLNVVPTMISYLLEGSAPPPEETARYRFCRSASAALPPEHLRGFEARFGISIIETMGLTETVAPSFSNPLEPTQRKLGSVGRASGCEARVIDAALKPVPDGETGELAIRGPNVMPGYYKNLQATEAAFTPDGWLRTGDLGHRDADGFFFVTGRIKELIIKGGENIAPREIDEALLRHPAVLDAAAVGIPDKHYGQEIMACIVLREGHAADEAALREFCVGQLGRYKTPSVFRFLSELPRGPSGKVQRMKLLHTAG
jgi:acyl-CoA synthetase (AMP-forming)/AMP-acid ligase II